VVGEGGALVTAVSACGMPLPLAAKTASVVFFDRGSARAPALTRALIWSGVA
jgi:hypothetical protein